MPLVDNDIIDVRAARRTGSADIQIDFDLIDGTTGETKYSGGIRYADADAAMAEIERREEDTEAAALALLSACRNRATGAFRPAIFDALPGRRFRVTQKVAEV